MTEVVNFLSRFGGLTVSGLLFVILWMFIKGYIRPAKHLDEVHATYIKIIEHKDKEILWWRDAWTIEQATRAKQEEALRESAEVGRMSLAMLQSLHQMKETPR